MAKNQMAGHTEKIAGAATPRERRTALKNAVAWAKDWLERLEAKKTQMLADFRRRKAAWGLHVGEHEVPHVIREQVNEAKIYGWAGRLAIAIEIGLASIVLLPLTLLIPSLSLAIALSVLVASLVTVAIAYLFHATLLSLAVNHEEPLEAIKRLNRYAILPTALLMLVSAVAWVALQRLDAATVLALAGVISLTKLTAMLGFVGLGGALLAKAHLLRWSEPFALEYEQTLDEIQVTEAKATEWKELLKDMAEPGESQKDEAEEQGLALLSAQTPSQPQLPANASNGAAASVKSTASPPVIALLALLAGVGSTGCPGPGPPPIKLTSVTGSMSVKLLADASGVDYKDALQSGGKNLAQNSPAILDELARNESTLASDFSVHWFGANGWNAEEKLHITLPQYPKPELIPVAPSEVCKVRPDACEVEKQQQKAALEAAQAQARIDYQNEVQKALTPLTAEILAPPPDTNSPCTDINGVFGRFIKNSSSPQILILLTDGRQNCGQNYEINQVAFPQHKVAVVVILVSGTENDGQSDFESRSKVFLTACPWAVVVPHHYEGLDKAVAGAVKKADEYAAQSQKPTA
jgi:hypothetical protein